MHFSFGMGQSLSLRADRPGVVSNASARKTQIAVDRLRILFAAMTGGSIHNGFDIRRLTKLAMMAGGEGNCREGHLLEPYGSKGSQGRGVGTSSNEKTTSTAEDLKKDGIAMLPWLSYFPSRRERQKSLKRCINPFYMKRMDMLNDDVLVGIRVCKDGEVGWRRKRSFQFYRWMACLAG